MAARIDAVGNVVGRYEASRPGAPALLIGSHIDTVRRRRPLRRRVRRARRRSPASRRCTRAGERLPFAFEVIAFGDEEGVRFPTTLTGSRALAGTLDPARSTPRTARGSACARRSPRRRRSRCHRRAAPAGRRTCSPIVEVHIEQGPVLEAEGLPVGVVTAINGATRVAGRGRARPAMPAPCRWRCAAMRLPPPPRWCSRSSASGRATEDLVGDRRADRGAARGGQRHAGRGPLHARPPRAGETRSARRRVAVLEATLRGDRRAARRRRSRSSRFHEPPAVACDPALIEAARRPRSGAPASRRASCRAAPATTHGVRGALPDRDAVRALRGRHQPQSGRGDQRRGRRPRGARAARLPRHDCAATLLTTAARARHDRRRRSPIPRRPAHAERRFLAELVRARPTTRRATAPRTPSAPRRCWRAWASRSSAIRCPDALVARARHGHRHQPRGPPPLRRRPGDRAQRPWRRRAAGRGLDPRPLWRRGRGRLDVRPRRRGLEVGLRDLRLRAARARGGAAPPLARHGRAASHLRRGGGRRDRPRWLLERGHQPAGLRDRRGLLLRAWSTPTTAACISRSWSAAARRMPPCRSPASTRSRRRPTCWARSTPGARTWRRGSRRSPASARRSSPSA